MLMVMFSTLAMPFYALATVPLIQKLTASVTQVWYADDAAACGKISTQWNQMSSLSPSFGYFSKIWQITKKTVERKYFVILL